MSASVELEAWMVMTAMLGLGLARSNVKSIFRPFLLYAVMGGIAENQRGQAAGQVRVRGTTPDEMW